MKRNPLSLRAKSWFATKVAAWAVLWALPIGTIGMGLAATVFLSVIGMGLMVLAAAPLVRLMNKRREEVERWKMSPTPGLTMHGIAVIIDDEAMTDEPWDEPQST